MSRLLARIMLVIFMIPAAAVVFTFGFMFMENYWGRSWRYGPLWIGGGVACWSFIAVYWTLLWRKSVNWNALRFWQTIIAIPGAAVLADLAGWICDHIFRESEYSFFLGAVVAPLGWLIATVFIWRETVAEHGARLKDARTGTLYCPTCGYNLTGLTSLRCPECGSQFTLEDLLAKQPSMLAGEIEKAA